MKIHKHKTDQHSIDRINENELVLLLSKDRAYLVTVKKNKICEFDLGTVNCNKIIGKRFGEIIESHLKRPLLLVKPSIIDFLNKKTKIMPQAVRPKDAALILAFTGINKESVVVEGGTGSAWLTIFLANYVKKVYSYEIRQDFFKNAKINVKASSLRNIVLKNKDITQGIDEKNIDLVICDMIKAETVVKHAAKALKPGGWFVVYSPYIEQVKAVTEEINKYSFALPFTVENILRYWEVREHTLPKRKGLMHTGFLTFARRLQNLKDI
ncbi:MAG: methyltransferase domain-containing protein [Candidatus Pacearchaeota archaeon]